MCLCAIVSILANTICKSRKFFCNSIIRVNVIVVVVVVVVVVPHYRMNRESSVGMVTRLRVGQPRVLSSIRGMAKTFFSETFWTAVVPIQLYF